MCWRVGSGSIKAAEYNSAPLQEPVPVHKCTTLEKKTSRILTSSENLKMIAEKEQLKKEKADLKLAKQQNRERKKQEKEREKQEKERKKQEKEKENQERKRQGKEMKQSSTNGSKFIVEGRGLTQSF